MIYTQPLDVEIEENGLITFDRAIFKIPYEKIKSTNAIMSQNNLPLFLTYYGLESLHK